MGHAVTLYLLVLVIFLAIDLTWLGVLMANFYKTELGLLARRSGEALAPVWWAAFLVYILIPLGIMLFVVPRVSPENLAASALGWGFLYGVILYGVYDLTNYSLIDRWPWRMTVLSDLLIPAHTGTKLTSCFIEAGFTAVLRPRPEPSSPQA